MNSISTPPWGEVNLGFQAWGTNITKSPAKQGDWLKCIQVAEDFDNLLYGNLHARFCIP